MDQNKILIKTIIDSLQDNKAKRIVVADMSEIEEAAFEYFIICEGTSSTQVGSIADHLIDDIRVKMDIRPFAYDGYKNCQWIAIDYGTILVHIFQREYRDFYNLEQLWADAKLTEIKDLD